LLVTEQNVATEAAEVDLAADPNGRNRWVAFLKRRWVLVILLVIAWWILATVFRGVHTLALSTASDSWFTAVLRDAAAAIRGNRTESPAFVYFFNPIRTVIQGFIEFIQSIISVPAAGNVIPLIGWLGVLALIGFIV